MTRFSFRTLICMSLAMALAVAGLTAAAPAAPTAFAPAAGQAALVKNINPTTKHDYAWPNWPNFITPAGNRVFFSSRTSLYGTELWTSDGTSGGTRLVRDIVPGSEDSLASPLGSLGNTLFFNALNQLWITDGTTAGTQLLRSSTGAPVLDPRSFASAGGLAYMTAASASVGGTQALWRSDGTAAGTFELLVSAGATTDDQIGNMTAAGNRLFFTANGGDGAGYELWASDGTVAGPSRLTDINPAGNSFSGGLSNLPDITMIGNLAYVVATTNGSAFTLWQIDLTSDTVSQVPNTSHLGGFGELTAIGTTLFFRAVAYDNSVMPPEPYTALWKLAPGDTAPVEVRRIGGALSSVPNSLTAVNGVLVFNGEGNRLWRSDGTPGGTFEIASVPIQSSGGAPPQIFVAGARAFFVGGTFFSFPPDKELWITDGTQAGTHQVRDLTPSGGTDFYSLAALGDQLFFSVASALPDLPAQNGALWVSDGTEAGTTIVRDIGLVERGFVVGPLEPPFFVRAGGKAFFTANNGDDGASYNAELWVTDGTAGGTRLTREINTTGSSYAGGMVALGDRVLFGALGDAGPGLWSSDGGEARTVAVRIFAAPDFSSGPYNLTLLGDKVYFLVRTPADKQLWRSDGTTVGTVRVATLPSSIYQPCCLVAVGDLLFFSAGNQAAGLEPWVSDGTEAGTHLLKDVRSGMGDSFPKNLTDVAGELYFTVGDTSNGFALWRSDGTEQGTVLVRRLSPETFNPFDKSPEQLTSAGTKLFFVAFDAQAGNELWVSDGTEQGTRMIKNIALGFYAGTTKPNDSLIADIMPFGDGVLFIADDLTHGRELWYSDGTEGGTVMVKDINPGAIGSGAGAITMIGDVALFAASNGFDGVELWQTDGTPAGTVQVQDLAPGVEGSQPFGFAVLGDQVLFVANNGVIGDELWALPFAQQRYTVFLPLSVR